MPLEAAPWVRGQIIEIESMPRNFGNAVRDRFWSWRAEFGKGSRMNACPERDTDTPGYFAAWHRDGKGVPCRFVCRCACGSAPPGKRLVTIFKMQAACKGWELSPQRVSVVEFEIRLAGRVIPGLAVGEGSYLSAARNQDFRTRRERIEALAEAESW